MINVEVLRKSAYSSNVIKHYEEQIDEKLEEAASKGFSRVKIYMLTTNQDDRLVNVGFINEEYIRTLKSLYKAAGFDVKMKTDGKKKKDDTGRMKYLYISF